MSTKMAQPVVERPHLQESEVPANPIDKLISRILPRIELNWAEQMTGSWNMGASFWVRFKTIADTIRYLMRFFFAPVVTITNDNELHSYVLGWLEAKALNYRFVKEYVTNTRVLAAAKRRPGQEKPEDKEVTYKPEFDFVWFFYRWSLIFITREIEPRTPHNQDPRYGPLKESMAITCLGRSINPIRRFIEACRETGKTVTTSPTMFLFNGQTQFKPKPLMQPFRSLDTVHLDEKWRKKIISDIAEYLDPDRRQFYFNNGIPYRRGYLLHGPPGCGKTSLAMALAGYFGLPLYVLECSSLADYTFRIIFEELPLYCFVLLEEIDCIGSWEGQRNYANRDLCTVSTLLNSLDGVSTSQGRVVIMSSNYPSKLLPALRRPGRIDMDIYMGPIDQQGAKDMFLRLMRSRLLGKGPAENSEDPERTKGKGAEAGMKADECYTKEQLEALAHKFSQSVPDKVLTPAQLQDFILRNLHSVTAIMDGMPAYLAEVRDSKNQLLDYDEGADAGYLFNEVTA